jgi:hypothetical protein
MPLTKLSLGGNHDNPAGDENIEKLFLRCKYKLAGFSSLFYNSNHELHIGNRVGMHDQSERRFFACPLLG